MRGGKWEGETMISRDFIAAVIFGLGCFLFFVVAMPQYDANANIRVLVKERRELLTQRTAMRDNVKELVRQYQTRKTDIDKLALLLPPKKQIDQIITSIQTAAQQTGMQLRGMSVGGASDASLNYKTTFIKLELGGSYPTLISFLKEMEKNLRLFDVLEINAGQDPNAKTPGLLSFEVKINAYNVK